MKAVDRTQLTREFDGSLDYDHEQWIKLRLVTTILVFYYYYKFDLI